MESIQLFIAEFIIEIKFYPTEVLNTKRIFVENLTRNLNNFIYKGKARKTDYYINVVWDIKQQIVERKTENEFYVNLYKKIGTKKLETYYQISFFHFQTILRNILYELLARNGGFLLHGSASNVNGASIFLGSSGAGKSTATKLLQDNFPILADDAVIIAKKGGKFKFYQTPFLEKNYIEDKSQSAVELKSIFFIHQSREFRINKIMSKEYVLKQMLEATFFLKNNKEQLKLLTEFVYTHNIFSDLYFAKDKKKMIKLINS